MCDSDDSFKWNCSQKHIAFKKHNAYKKHIAFTKHIAFKEHNTFKRHSNVQEAHTFKKLVNKDYEKVNGNSSSSIVQDFGIDS